MKELGVHILVCSASYALPNGNGEKKTFRKFYKFQVSHPLGVKTKINTNVDGKVFLEAQVQNLSNQPLFLEKLQMDAMESFSCQSVSLKQKPDRSRLADSLLQPLDVIQYLYIMTPNTLAARNSTNLAKLDIFWRSNFCEAGRLQTSHLSRKPPPPLPPHLSHIECSIVKVSDPIIVEAHFTIILEVFNISTQTSTGLLLSSQKTKMGGVLMVGKSQFSIGVLGPREKKRIEVPLFALNSGIVKVEGLRLVDMDGEGFKELELGSIFIVNN